MYYYCDANGTVQGPYTFAQIGEWVADGSLPGATTYVQHTEAPQGEEWVSYDAACAGVGTAVGTAAAASFYDDAQAVAEQVAYPEADSEAVPGEAAEEWGYGGTVERQEPQKQQDYQKRQCSRISGMSRSGTTWTMRAPYRARTTQRRSGSGLTPGRWVSSGM